MNPWRCAAGILCVFSIGAAVLSAGERPYNPYAGVLKEHGVEPTLAGVRGYLQSLVPSDEERRQRGARAEALIAQLSDSRFKRREQAMRKLVAMSGLPREKVAAAVESKDPEVRWRCEQVLKLTSRPDPLPEAVCRTIALLRIKGAAPVLIEAMPQLGPPHVRRAAEQALVATARREDGPLLRKAMRHDQLPLKTAAIAAYAAALGEEGREQLRPLLKAERAPVRLAAARALANRGDRAALPVLLRLLEANDVEIRAQSVAVLRGLTGQQFGYLAYDDKTQREAVQRWKIWLDEDGQTARLTFPLTGLDDRAVMGHTLVLIYRKSKAVEFNAAGEIIWEKDGLDVPWAVERLPNGNTLVGSYRGKWVAEFDRRGEQVWRVDGLPGGVFGVDRLANGNTLLGCHKSKKVIEVDRAGKIVWEATCDGQPMGVQRLANGNTLVALHVGRKVVELDRTGKVVWEVAGLGIPRTAQRLPNGNTLVGDSGKDRVVEFDRRGEEVWSHDTPSNVYEARRLTNGNTMISDGRAVYIIDRDGNRVWEKQMPGAGRAIRF